MAKYHSETSAKGTIMRAVFKPRFVLLLLLLLSFGCASENKGKLEGTKWSSQAVTIKGKTVPAGFLALEFSTDGHVRYIVGGQTFSGTYSLGMGSNVTLSFDQELAGRKTHTQKITIRGKVMTFTDTDGTSVDFNKVE
jgi:hypothetical protein